MRAVAEVDVLHQVLGGVVIVEAVLVGLHPVTLVLVQMDALYATRDTLRIQPASRTAVYRLRHRVVERVVHTLLQPELSAVTFLNLVDTVVAQRGGVLVVGEEGTYAVTVIAVQAIARTQPDVSLGVTEDAVHHRVRQSLTGVQPLEFHVRNHTCTDLCHQTEDCH